MITVVTPAVSQDLVTLLDLKNDLGLTDTSQDVLLASMVQQASAAVAQYCDRVFRSERVRETLESDGGPFLFVSRGPVTTLHGITYGDDATVVPSSDYVLADDRMGMIRAKTGYWRNTSQVGGLQLDRYTGPQIPFYEVDYTAGYAAESIPSDLQRATLELCKALWFARDRDPYLESINVPDVISKTWGSGAGRASMATGGMPPVVALLLKPYVRKFI